ncbi:hypothetical protein TREES_T100002814 [Tupaia chinensis]|uniref:Uncharacterized protein n=1 Tax=Tupaia chinensis TaxID=246437 RepID=L9KXE1_TUPCH|nr:hypothetical protein TREES_T100002814 [Tupaia chinensis]
MYFCKGGHCPTHAYTIVTNKIYSDALLRSKRHRGAKEKKTVEDLAVTSKTFLPADSKKEDVEPVTGTGWPWTPGLPHRFPRQQARGLKHNWDKPGQIGMNLWNQYEPVRINMSQSELVCKHLPNVILKTALAWRPALLLSWLMAAPGPTVGSEQYPLGADVSLPAAKALLCLAVGLGGWVQWGAEPESEEQSVDSEGTP